MRLLKPAGPQNLHLFAQAERESFKKNQEALGLVDCFRRQYPDTVGEHLPPPNPAL